VPDVLERSGDIPAGGSLHAQPLAAIGEAMLDRMQLAPDLDHAGRRLLVRQAGVLPALLARRRFEPIGARPDQLGATGLDQPPAPVEAGGELLGKPGWRCRDSGTQQDAHGDRVSIVQC